MSYLDVLSLLLVLFSIMERLQNKASPWTEILKHDMMKIMFILFVKSTKADRIEVYKTMPGVEKVDLKTFISTSLMTKNSSKTNKGSPASYNEQ